MTAARDVYRTAMRADLLAAAERVIARTGLTGLTIRAILDEAGVAPGTLYSYFSGKEEILEAIAERALAQYVAGVREAGASPAEAFLAIVEAAFTNPPEGAALLADLRGRPTDGDHASAVRRLNADLVQATAPMLDSTTIRDPEAFAELLDIVWDGLTRRAGSNTFVTDFERVGRTAVELLTAPLCTTTDRPTRSRR